jgi:hypothetical protein
MRGWEALRTAWYCSGNSSPAPAETGSAARSSTRTAGRNPLKIVLPSVAIAYYTGCGRQGKAVRATTAKTASPQRHDARDERNATNPNRNSDEDDGTRTRTTTRRTGTGRGGPPWPPGNEREHEDDDEDEQEDDDQDEDRGTGAAVGAGALSPAGLTHCEVGP